MKRKILSVLLTLCMAVTLLPTVAFAADPPAPTVSDRNICANGVPIKIVVGTTTDYTNILYDIDNNGTIENGEYLQIGANAPTAAGYDLSRYTIFGGAASDTIKG